MESQLSKQLRFLRSTLPQASDDDTKSSDSFLFSPKKAASIRTDEIRVISLSGLNSLVKYDRRFESFKETLFSEKSLGLKRELQNQDVNEKIDSSISNFLGLLGPFLLLRPAQKTIEYLVRKYRCHHFNVDELMALFLPYHNTILFPAIIRILHLDGTKWGFLEKLKVTQEPVPRSTIISRSVNDFTLIEFVMDQLRIGGMNHRAYINFYTTLLVEYINELKILDDLKLKRLLTTVFWNLSHEEFEIRCSGLMILTQISSKMNFTQELFSEITNLVASNIDRIRPRPSIIFLVYLYQSQNTESNMPIAVLRRILDRVPLLIEVMKEVSKTYSPFNFLSSFLKSLLEISMKEESDEINNDNNNKSSFFEILLKWLDEYEGIRGHVSELIPDLFQYYRSKRSKIKTILRLIESRYSQELDIGIDKSVRLSRVKNDGELLEFIRLTFRGTRHHLTERNNHTLIFVLFHTDHNMRALGIREMERLVHQHQEQKKKKIPRSEDRMEDEGEVEEGGPQHTEEFLTFVSDSLLSSLEDESLSVLREVFNFKNVLAYVPLEEFIPKSIEVFRSIKSKLGRDRRVGKIIKKVARLFTSPKLFEQHQQGSEEGTSYNELILPFILEFLYAEKSLKKTNIHIFNSLAQLEGMDMFKGSKALIKETEKMNVGKRNHELIQFLAKNILESEDKNELMMKWIGYGESGSAMKLVLFVLNEIFGSRNYRNTQHLKLFMNLVSPIIEKMKGSAFKKDLFKNVTTSNSKPSIKNREFNVPTLSVLSLYVISKSLPNFTTNDASSSELSNLESTAKELFIRMSSRNDCVSLFTPHLSILLDKLGSKSVSFFSTCWVAEDCEEIPVTTVKRSVDICGRLVRLNSAKYDFKRLLIPLICCSCSSHANRKDVRVSLKSLLRFMMDSASNQQQQQEKETEGYNIEFMNNTKEFLDEDYLRILKHFVQSDITENTDDVIYRILDTDLRSRLLEFAFSCLPNIPSVRGKILLLKSFVKVRNPKKIDYTLEVLKSLVGRISELSLKETELLDLLIETIHPGAPSTETWESVIKPALGLTDPIPNVPTYVPSQSCQGIIFKEEYFEEFTDDQKKETFLEIFEVFRDKRSKTRDITITFHRTLKRLNFPTSAINEIWNRVTKSDFVSPSNRMEDEDDEEVNETSGRFHDTTVLLELLHVVNFRLPLGTFVLSLNNTLTLLLALPDPPSYLMGLLLSLMTKISKTLLIALNENEVEESSNSFSIELLLRVIESFTKREEESGFGIGIVDTRSTSDIRSEILILFSSLVELIPAKVAPHMSSLLHFLGTSLQTRDSDTIEMVENFVKKMVPFYVLSDEDGESEDSSESNRMIVSITSAYCDAWESLPLESRERSFASLVKAVGRKRLHLVMIRYLSSVRNREEIDGVKRPEQREFARSLIRYFTIPKQVRCLVELVEYCQKTIQNPLKDHSSGFYEKYADQDEAETEDGDDDEEEMMEEKYEFGLYLLEFVMSFLGHIEFLSDIANFERSGQMVENKDKKKKGKKNEDVVQELILGLLIHSVRMYTSSRSQRSDLIKDGGKGRSISDKDESEEEEEEDEEEGEGEDEESDSDDDDEENELLDILDEICDTLDKMITKIMQLVSTSNFIRFVVSLLRTTRKRKGKQDLSHEENLHVLTKTISILNTKLADKTMDNTKRLHINSKLYVEKLLPKVSDYFERIGLFSPSDEEETTKKKKKKRLKRKKKKRIDLKKNEFFLSNTRLCQSLIISLELMARRFVKFGKSRFLHTAIQLVCHFENLLTSFCSESPKKDDVYFVHTFSTQQLNEEKKKNREASVESYITSLSMACCSYFKEMGMTAMSEFPKLTSSTMKLFHLCSSVENNIRRKFEERENSDDEEDDEDDLLERRMNSMHLYISSLKHSIFVLLKSHGKFFSSQNLKDTLDVLFHLSTNEKKCERTEEEEKEGVFSFSERMRNEMLKTVPLRITLPILLSSQIFHQARRMAGPGPFRFLMRTLSFLFKKSTSNELSGFGGEIVEYFMKHAFCIREENQENGRKKPEIIEQEENQVIRTLLSYVLKLNEERMFGLVNKIITWTKDKRTSSPLNFTRTLVFLKTMNQVIEKLDILFLPLCTQRQYTSLESDDEEEEEEKNSLIELCGKLIEEIISQSQESKEKKKKKNDIVTYSGGGRKRLFSEREEEIEKEASGGDEEDDRHKDKDISLILSLVFDFMENVFRGMSSKNGKEIINNIKEKEKKKKRRQTEDEILLGMENEEEKNEKEITAVYKMIETVFLVPVVKQMEVFCFQVGSTTSTTQEEMMGMYEQRERKWIDCLCTMVGCVPNTYSEFHDTTHKLFVSFIQKTIMSSSTGGVDKERILLAFLRGLNGCYETNLQGYIGYLPKSVPLMKEVREKYGDESMLISEEIEEFIEIVEDFETEDGEEVEVRNLIMS